MNKRNFDNKQQFDFGKATESQIEAITHTKGPLLITAGPGSGKTFTLVKRVVYLIVVKNVKPENIMLTTFTRKAAKELRSRLIKELRKYETTNRKFNISKMYLGTIHSLCERILHEFVTYSSLGKNPSQEDLRYMSYLKNHRLIDDVEAKMFISTKLLPLIYKQNKEDSKFMYKYYEILNSYWKEHHESWKGKYSRFTEISNILSTVSTLISSNVDINKLVKEEQDSVENMMGRLTKLYIEETRNNYLLDNTMLLVETLNLLTKNQVARKKIQDQIQYLLIDEYQDTDKIQEQIIFLIGAEHKNICVVGDDDQSLYRWRGATVENILSFKDRFTNCKEIKLEINFRSPKRIVDFSQDWINLYDWKKARLQKNIRANDKPNTENVTYDSVTLLACRNEELKEEQKSLEAGLFAGNEDDWLQNCLCAIKKIKQSEFVNDYSDIVFLFRSVKNVHVKLLAKFLENNGIPIYSPRSGLLFQRPEIKLIIGLLLHIFNWFIKDKTQVSYLGDTLKNYYLECYDFCSSYFKLKPHEPNMIQEWIFKTGDKWADNSKINEFSLSKIIYESFQFKPIAKLLDVDLNASVYEQRITRNISLIIELISKFDNLFHAEDIDKTIIHFFNKYMKILYTNSLNEYESEKEVIPKGCISFLTFHQAKGMEFPVTIVGSINQFPKFYTPNKIDNIKYKYSKIKNSSKEDINCIMQYDYYRDYYVAFTRAQKLLVLMPGLGKTGWDFDSLQITYWQGLYELLSDYPYIFDCKFPKRQIVCQSEDKILESYTYTKHIELYKKCSLRYKFYRELNFVEPSTINTFFGSLVHQTIEDINVAAINYSHNPRYIEAINRSVDTWFQLNYESLSKCKNITLSTNEKSKALRQIKDYIKFIGDRWDEIYASEADIDYYFADAQFIIKGATDLVRKKTNGKYEIIDFKTGKKPKDGKFDYQVKLYQKQIELYAYLLKASENKEVDTVKLFYTGEVDNPEIAYDVINLDTKNFENEIVSTIKNIEQQNFEKPIISKEACKWCPFIHYCNNSLVN